MDATALQYSFAHALALALLHSLWQVALLALAARLVLSACSRRRAALRHTIGMAFLLAMVGVPAWTALRVLVEPTGALEMGPLALLTAPVVVAPGHVVQESGTWPAWLSLAWLLGAAAMLLRHLGGWQVVRALDRSPWAPLPAAWQRRVDALQAALRIGRRLTVRVGADIVAPFTARLLRPVVWLPASLLARLPVEQVEALIAHELAHVARLDWVWNGVQCVVESLLFFHPAAWWLGRRIREEREHACDDLAVRACAGSISDPAIALAEALASLAGERHAPAPHLVLSAQGGSLMLRISRLLTDENGRTRWRWPVAIATVLAASTLLAASTAAVRDRFPNLHIAASTDGPLGPGDWREIRTAGVDHARVYRVSLDADGKRTETYSVDGRPHAIDASARRWIDTVTRMSVPPPPPAPPAPPDPPAPPAPPSPPDFASAGPVRELIEIAANDPGVIARVGTPVVLLDDVDGNIQLSDEGDLEEGSADLQIPFAGPRGKALVEVEAYREGGEWFVQVIDVHPASK